MSASAIMPTGTALRPADPSDFQFDFYASPGPVTFVPALHSGSGSVAFAGFSLDQITQRPLPSPLTVTLQPGAHVLRFVVAFSDPQASAVIMTAGMPGQSLKLVDASHPLSEIRIKV